MRLFALFSDAQFLRRFHACAALFWLVMAIPSMIWWKNSLPYLIFISVYAIVAGHWASYQGASAEAKEDQIIDDQQTSPPNT